MSLLMPKFHPLVDLLRICCVFIVQLAVNLQQIDNKSTTNVLELAHQVKTLQHIRNNKQPSQNKLKR